MDRGAVAFGGAVVLIALRGLLGRAAGSRLGGGLGLAVFAVAIAAYLVVGVLAFIGGPAVVRVEAILLTGLVFLGFNAAWLLLFDNGPDSRPSGSAEPITAEPAAGSADIDTTPTASGWAPDA